MPRSPAAPVPPDRDTSPNFYADLRAILPIQNAFARIAHTILKGEFPEIQQDVGDYHLAVLAEFIGWQVMEKQAKTRRYRNMTCNQVLEVVKTDKFWSNTWRETREYLQKSKVTTLH